MDVGAAVTEFGGFGLFFGFADIAFGLDGGCVSSGGCGLGCGGGLWGECAGCWGEGLALGDQAIAGVGFVGVGFEGGEPLDGGGIEEGEGAALELPLDGGVDASAEKGLGMAEIVVSRLGVFGLAVEELGAGLGLLTVGAAGLGSFHRLGSNNGV